MKAPCRKLYAKSSPPTWPDTHTPAAASQSAHATGEQPIGPSAPCGVKFATQRSDASADSRPCAAGVAEVAAVAVAPMAAAIQKGT